MKNLFKKDGKYTLKEGESAHPPKYSPEDKYASYRRKAKYDR